MLKISKDHISDLELKKQCLQNANDQSIMSLERENHSLKKLLSNSLNQNSKKELENSGLKELLKTSADRNQILEQTNLDLRESRLCKKCMEEERYDIPFEQIRELKQENNRLQVCEQSKVIAQVFCKKRGFATKNLKIVIFYWKNN